MVDDYNFNMSEYDIEIEHKKEELKKLYKAEGTSEFTAIQGGGVAAIVLLVIISIVAICNEQGRIYGIIGLVLCVIGIMAVVLGIKYRNNKIDRLEREIAELENKKRLDEQKYNNLQR